MSESDRRVEHGKLLEVSVGSWTFGAFATKEGSDEGKGSGDRWSKYPTESHEEHHGHERAKTRAPRVWYCYDCERHYRPPKDCEVPRDDGTGEP